MLGNYFEGIGILVYRKLVEPDIVQDFWGGIIPSTWNDLKPLISEMRKESGDAEMFKFWEYLVDRMNERKREVHG